MEGITITSWMKIFTLQKELLTEAFNWNYFKKIKYIHNNSLAFGPELTFVGTRYDEVPLRIVLLGLNPYYNESDKAIGGNGTRQWVLNQFPNLKDIKSLTETQYMAIQNLYEEEVKGYNYVTGAGISSEYTIPKVVNFLFTKYSKAQASKDEANNKLIDSIIPQIALINFYPFEGQEDAGTTKTTTTAYGHIFEYLSHLEPDLVLVFHGSVWNHLYNQKSRSEYKFSTDSGSNLLLHRRAMKEHWFLIYHFAPRSITIEKRWNRIHLLPTLLSPNQILF